MAIVALVAGLVACRDDPAAVSTTDDPRVAELTERRAGWEERRPDTYRFTVETQCFCLDTVSRPRTLTVDGDDVVSEEPPPGEDALAERIMTVDDLFDQAGRAVEEADDVQIDYDAEFDFPSAIAVDMVAEAIDDEVTYLVTSFEPVD